MSDLKDSLERLADGQRFTPVDVAAATSAGRAALRHRRWVIGVAAVGTGLVVALVVPLGLRTSTMPDLGFSEPGERLPAAGSLPTSVTYPDLVVSREGRGLVEIEGFGWPIGGMEPVSGADGSIAFREISQADGESMCLPMLEQAAPEVPAAAWEHSSSWIDRFPSRATLPMTVVAEHGGTSYEARCALPGDYVPDVRPDLSRVPGLSEDPKILEQCSYLGHVDFAGWEVAATAEAVGRVVAALRSDEGYVATCALSDNPNARVVQVSELEDGPTTDDMMIYDLSAGSFVMAGLAPDGAESVELRVGDAPTTTTDVADGVFAAAVPSRVADEFGVVARLRAYDADGLEIGSWSSKSERPPVLTLLPSTCFYSSQRDPGAC
ncbi:MAG: hypothetical protein WKF79_11900 [Nocardioides sp.]